MPKNALLHVRVDENVKINTENILAEHGLTISDAFNIMLCQVNIKGKLTFQVKLPAPENIIVNNKSDIERNLNEAEQDISNSNVLSSGEAFGALD